LPKGGNATAVCTPQLLLEPQSNSSRGRRKICACATGGVYQKTVLPSISTGIAPYAVYSWLYSCCVL